MKLKSLLASMMLMCAGLTASAQMAGEPQITPSADSQGPGTLKWNVGLAYGTKAGFDENFDDTGKLGISAGVEYFFTPNISLSPNYTYFFPSTAEMMGYEVTANLSEINIDGRYYFGAGNVSLYGLTGLSIAYVKAEAGDRTESENKSGVNLGGGLLLPISETVGLDAQIRYNSPIEQIVLRAGIVFRIK